MHIKKLVLDGFKSYGVRTEINDWDPNFCSVAGANGSGKDNILDVICFVLGISALSQVRASCTRQLVYKEGNGSVQSASVTIYFDNSDPKSSPVGYEACKEIAVTRQVVLGGRNKYLINGHTAQQSRVQNLFHSVQLNVNNPHFLIMQGRITKVLNMKPPEILGMIEEAAGTRMYERQKLAALATIAKKDVKVQEITTRLDEEIEPQLRKLQAELKAYTAFNQLKAEVQRLERFSTALSFHQTEMKIRTGDSELRRRQDQLLLLQEDAEVIEQEIEAVVEEVEGAVTQRDASIDGEVAALQAKADDASRRLVQATSAWKNQQEALEEEQRDATTGQDTVGRLEETLRLKQEVLRAAQEENTRTEQAFEAMKTRVASLEGQQIGIDVDDKGAQGSLPQQLMEAERLLAEAEAEADQARTRQKHLGPSLKAKLAELKAAESEHGKQEWAKEVLKAAIEAAEANVEREALEDLEAEMAELGEAVTSAQKRMDVVQAQYQEASAACSRVEFEFASPPGFDQSNVKGRLAQLL